MRVKIWCCSLFRWLFCNLSIKGSSRSLAFKENLRNYKQKKGCYVATGRGL
jgi:hypothetical protein